MSVEQGGLIKDQPPACRRQVWPRPLVPGEEVIAACVIRPHTSLPRAAGLVMVPTERVAGTG